MKIKFSIFFVVIFLVNISFCAISDYITFQGKLTDSAGESLDGSYDIRINFYEVASGGSVVWFVEVSNVSVESGLYSIEISTANGLFNKEYWVEIGIKPAGSSNEYEYFSRYRLTSGVYAIRSKYSDTASTATYAVSAGGFAINED